MNKLTKYEQEAIDWWNERLSEQEYPSDYGGDNFWEDDGWILATSWNPTQDKLSEIAFDLFKQDLEEEEPDNIEQVRFKHWACGYVLQLNVRPIVNNRLTKVGEMVYDYSINEGFMDYFDLAYEDERYHDWCAEMMRDYVEWGLRDEEEFDDLTDEQYTLIATALECDEPYATVEYDGSVYISDRDFDLIKFTREILAKEEEE